MRVQYTSSFFLMIFEIFGKKVYFFTIFSKIFEIFLKNGQQIATWLMNKLFLTLSNSGDGNRKIRIISKGNKNIGHALTDIGYCIQHVPVTLTEFQKLKEQFLIGAEDYIELMRLFQGNFIEPM